MSKEKIIGFKIEAHVKEDFERICKDNHTTASHELRLFVHQRIKQSQGKKLLLNEIKHKTV